MMTDLNAVFFDFDGVVLDSVNVKTEAFGDMFAEHGESVRQAVVEYHLNNGGVSRFEKFRYFYETLLGLPMDEACMARLCDQFSDLTLHKVLEAPFIEGALDTLQFLKDSGIPAFVASGTPQDELERIVQGRELTHYFSEVHGSPRTKAEIAHEVAKSHGLRLDRCLFIGDAMTDYEAAGKCGMAFLGVRDNDHSPFPEGTVTTTILSRSALEEAWLGGRRNS
ncbi:HAD-IA family hydrolase [uncultured Pseudodesulfovibrio sp.]|uniref:HAD family hydrolase n=1 Tax=uncultured Pseudodesulfovibrio sp. TaxID=2035858 RepID=UPI0029C8EF7B|nr:HAD-IA family hydrolase [uncultured Pseudodesulfovibrio sp.]